MCEGKKYLIYLIYLWIQYTLIANLETIIKLLKETYRTYFKELPHTEELPSSVLKIIAPKFIVETSSKFHSTTLGRF
jgi:hypothetical protein